MAGVDKMSNVLDDFIVWITPGILMFFMGTGGMVGWLPMRGWRWRVPREFKAGGRIIFSYPYCFFTHWGLNPDGWCPNCGYGKQELLKNRPIPKLPKGKDD